MGFEMKPLEELANVTKLAGFEFTKYFSYNSTGEIIAIRGLNIKNGRLSLRDIKRIDKNVSDNLLRSKLYKDEIVLTYTGTIGNVAIIEENDKFHLAPNVAKITVNKNNNSYFYYSYFTSEIFRKQLYNYSVGSTQATIPMKTIRKLVVPNPPLIVQNKIAILMKQIDDKINVNIAIIQKLEGISETIFKRWFVDFEFPNEYGESYKSSGGEIIESDMGDIPKEWKIGTLNDLGKITGGGTPSKKIEDYYTDNEISWITPKDLSNNQSLFVYQGATDITKEALKKSSANLLPENTVLFSSRAPIGYIAIAGKNLATNQGFKSIIPAQNIPTEYIFFLLKHLTPTIEANAGGSTFKEISGTGMKGIKTILPPSTILLKYKVIVESWFEKIRLVENENKILVDLREALLPKLLSGEIELPDETEVIKHVPIP